jgi:hypothetical protein
VSRNAKAMHAISHTFTGPIDMVYSDIRCLDARLSHAQSALRRACAFAWPVGASVEFYLNGNQSKPSNGTVCHHYEAYVGVEMEKPSRSGHRTIKRVHYTNMATLPARQQHDHFQDAIDAERKAQDHFQDATKMMEGKQP